MIGRHSSFAFELTKKISDLWQTFPDRWKEKGPLVLIADDQTIYAWPELPEQISLVIDGHLLRRTQDRDRKGQARYFIRSQFWKSGIAKGGGETIFGAVDNQRPMRDRRTNTATKGAVLFQGYETGPWLRQPSRVFHWPRGEGLPTLKAVPD